MSAGKINLPPSTRAMHNGFWQQANFLTASDKILPLRATRLAMEAGEERESAQVAVSDEAAMVISKMCELFVRYVSAQAGVFARRSARRSVRDEDVVSVFLTDHVFDFCIDIARFDPNDRLKRFPPTELPPIETASSSSIVAAPPPRTTGVVGSSIPAPLSHVVAPAMLTLVRPKVRQRTRKNKQQSADDDVVVVVVDNNRESQ
jgi:histone H3/H4